MESLYAKSTLQLGVLTMCQHGIKMWSNTETVNLDCLWFKPKIAEDYDKKRKFGKRDF